MHAQGGGRRVLENGSLYIIETLIRAEDQKLGLDRLWSGGER